MKQGWRALAVCVAIALVSAVVAPAMTPAAQAAGRVAQAAASKAKPKKAAAKTYQFTGVVVALEKSSLTVQKGKKKPTTKVFSKHEDMRVTGDLEEGARVTVYYRNEGREAVAHRVVVKSERTASKR